MRCENVFCVYCNKEKCILKEISLNEIGMCDCCINVNIPEQELKKYRKTLLKMYDESDNTDILSRVD